jgi:site-specific recombinase XerC
MTSVAPHITVFLKQYLPVDRGASVNTCESYAYAFKLLFEYASNCLNITPSELHFEQLDAPLIVNFLNFLETERGNGPNSRNIRLAAIKSFMHFMEYRVPTALEQIRRILAIPAKKIDIRLVRHLRAIIESCV